MAIPRPSELEAARLPTHPRSSPRLIFTQVGVAFGAGTPLGYGVTIEFTASLSNIRALSHPALSSFLCTSPPLFLGILSTCTLQSISLPLSPSHNSNQRMEFHQSHRRPVEVAIVRDKQCHSKTHQAPHMVCQLHFVRLLCIYSSRCQ